MDSIYAQTVRLLLAAAPDVHAGDLPALRWKLSNLQTFSKSRPAEFQKQAKELEVKLS